MSSSSYVLHTYANDIFSVHFVKVLLSFLAECQTFADRQSFCDHLRRRGSAGESGSGPSRPPPTPVPPGDVGPADSMPVRGRELFEKLKSGSLPVSGFHDSGGDSRLMQFGLQETMTPNYFPQLPHAPPQNFRLLRDLALLENSLAVKCIFYMPFLGPSVATSPVRYIKLLETLQYQTMSSFRNDGQIECYEIVLCPRQFPDGTCRVEFQVVIEGRLNYSVMSDEARFMTVIKYVQPAWPIWYSFEEHEVCHVNTFRRHFLRHLLPQNPATIGLLTEFQNGLADSGHVCQDNLKWCHQVCGLQLLMNDFFAGFPASILFLVVEGINWFISQYNLKRKLLAGYRESLPSMKSYATRVIFKYLPPRRPGQDLAEYELKSRADPEFMVVLSGRRLYLCNERTRRQLIKFCLVRGALTSQPGQRKKKKNANQDDCPPAPPPSAPPGDAGESDVREVEEFVWRVRDQLEKEKRQLLGQSGFSSAKAKKEYRERTKKLLERLGENFADHCSPICSRLPEIARHVPVGQASKLYTIARPLESLLKEIGLFSPQTEGQIKKCLSLSCFAFDTETMGIPANETVDNCPHRVYNTEDGTFAQFGMQDQPEPDGPGTRPVILQDLLVIGVVDHHDDACLPASKLPYVFMWPRQLYHAPVLAQLYMMEAFLVFLMKKQIFLFHEKFQRLEPVFDVIRRYQRVYYDMFLQRHSLTDLDLFPCQALQATRHDGSAAPVDPFSPASHHLLTDFEEVFFTPQNERLDDLFANWDRQFSTHREWVVTSSSSSSSPASPAAGPAPGPAAGPAKRVVPATLSAARRARLKKEKSDPVPGMAGPRPGPGTGTAAPAATAGDTWQEPPARPPTANRAPRKSRKRKRPNAFIVSECRAAAGSGSSSSSSEEEEEPLGYHSAGSKSTSDDDDDDDEDDSDMNDFVVPDDQVTGDPDEVAAYARVNNAAAAAAAAAGRAVGEKARRRRPSPASSDDRAPPDPDPDPVLKAREHILNLRQFWFGSVFGQIQTKLMQVCAKQIVYGFNMEGFDGPLILGHLLAVLQKNGRLFDHASTSTDLGHANHRDGWTDMADARYYYQGSLERERWLDLQQGGQGAAAPARRRHGYLRAVFTIRQNSLRPASSSSSCSPEDHLERMLVRQRGLADYLPLGERLAIRFCGQLTSRGVKASGQGNKVWKLKLNSNSILCEATKLLGVKGYSLKQLAEITGVAAENAQEASKGSFPYAYIQSVEQLDETELPRDLQHWQTNLGQLAPLDQELNVIRTGSPAEREKMLAQERRRLEKIVASRDTAVRDFAELGCASIYDYLLHYLYRDCRMLLRSMEKFRGEMSELLQFDFISGNFFTLPSLSSTCMLKQLSDDKRMGLRFVNDCLEYAILRHAFVGGGMVLSRTVAGQRADKLPYMRLQRDFKKFTRDFGLQEVDLERRRARRYQQLLKFRQRRQAGQHQAGPAGQHTSSSGGSDDDEEESDPESTRREMLELSLCNGNAQAEIQYNQAMIYREAVVAAPAGGGGGKGTGYHLPDGHEIANPAKAVAGGWLAAGAGAGGGPAAAAPTSPAGAAATDGSSSSSRSWYHRLAQMPPGPELDRLREDAVNMRNACQPDNYISAFDANALYMDTYVSAAPAACT